MEWIRFFVGTPQRFLGSFLGFFILAGVFIPGVADAIAARIMAAVNSLFAPLLVIAFIYWVLGGMVRSLLGGGRRRH